VDVFDRTATESDGVGISGQLESATIVVRSFGLGTCSWAEVHIPYSFDAVMECQRFDVCPIGSSSTAG